MKRVLLLSLISLLMIANHAQAQYVTADDNAGSYGGWSNGDNLGFGFGGWSLYTGGGTAGWFIGNSASSGFGDINTNGKSFGLWGNPGGALGTNDNNWVNADRSITNWGDGYSFSIDLAVAYTSGDKGIDLFNSSGAKIWNFNTGSGKYVVGLAGSDLNWSYSQTSIFKLTVTQNGNNLGINLVRGSDSYVTTLNNENLKSIKLYCSKTNSGSDLNNLYFNNLKVEVSDPTKVTLSSQVKVNGNVSMSGNMNCTDLNIPIGNSLTINSTKTLTVTGGLTNNAGNTGLVIKSDASGTGSLIHNSSNVPATVERYITGSSVLTSKVYHQVSIPLTADANPTSNLFFGSYLFSFNEAGGDGTADHKGEWVALGASTTTPLNVDNGYLLYYPDASTTYNFAGNLRNGSVSPALTWKDANHGYNLIPNPYPSAIDWDAASGWSLTNVNDAIYVWNSSNTIANYGSYVGATTTNGVTNIIPVGQSFFVHANAASPSISMNNNVRVHNNTAFMKSGQALNPHELHLFAQSNGVTDEIAVRFASDATENFDGHADAYKFSNGLETPQLSSLTTDGTQLSINSLPFTDGDVLVPLNFSLTHAAEVTFSATGIESFNPNATLYFEDTELGQVINLREQPVYTINYGGGAAENRFWLRMGSLTVSQQENLKINGTVFASHGKITLDIPSMQNKNVTINVFNSLGQLVSLNKAVMTGIYQVSSPLQPGVYIVKVGCNELNFTQKIIIK